MTPPKILFMGRIFEVPWGGVRQMAEALLRAAAPIAARQERTIEVLTGQKGLVPVRHEAIREVVLPQRAGSRILWDHHTVPQYANRQKNAVLYNIKLVLPERLNIPGFTTIHDLMYFPQPEKYRWREYLLGDSLYMRLMVRRTVRRAPCTHVDSRYTARDAEDLFPIVDSSRFRPIPPGVDQGRWAPRPWSEKDEKTWSRLEGIGLRRPYLFYSGGLSPRKNVAVLALAFERFARRYPEYSLVLTGGPGPTAPDPRLRRAFYTIPTGKLLRLGMVDDRELELLYQNADAFVYPSLYEGFGMPPLEAQAAGCPVICSNATSLPEVVGDSALTFDPRSPRQLLERMEELMDPDVCLDVIERGRRNAAHFRWEKTARQWLALADEVYEEGLK